MARVQSRLSIQVARSPPDIFIARQEMLTDSPHEGREFIPMPEVVGFTPDSLATKAATLKVVSTIAIQ